MNSFRLLMIAIVTALALTFSGCPRESARPDVSIGIREQPTTGLGVVDIPSDGPSSAFTGDRAMEHTRALAEEIGPRLMPSDALDAATKYVSEQLIDLGLAPEQALYDLPDGTAAANIIAVIPGISEQERVLACHLDTVAECPGANDDASGAGAMLELAEMLVGTEFPLSVRLCFFTAEEALEGADEHGYSSAQYMKSLNPDQIGRMAAVCWLDKIAAGSSLKVLYIADARSSVALELGQLAHSRDLKPTVTGADRWSEEMAFEDYDIPTAWVEWGPASELHSPGDDMRNVAREKLVAIGDLIHTWLTEEPSE